MQEFMREIIASGGMGFKWHFPLIRIAKPEADAELEPAGSLVSL